MLSLVFSVDVIVLVGLIFCLCVKGSPATWLFTWLPLLMSLMVTNFVLSLPTGCLGWDLGLKCLSS